MNVMFEILNWRQNLTQSMLNWQFLWSRLAIRLYLLSKLTKLFQVWNIPCCTFNIFWLNDETIVTTIRLYSLSNKTIDKSKSGNCNPESWIVNSESPIDDSGCIIDNSESFIDNSKSAIDNSESAIDNLESTIDKLKSKCDNSESVIDNVQWLFWIYYWQFRIYNRQFRT